MKFSQCSKTCVLIYTAMLLLTIGFVGSMISWFAPAMNGFVTTVRIIGPSFLLSGGIVLLISCVFCGYNQGKCPCCHHCSERYREVKKDAVESEPCCGMDTGHIEGSSCSGNSTPDFDLFHPECEDCQFYISKSGNFEKYKRYLVRKNHRGNNPEITISRSSSFMTQGSSTTRLKEGINISKNDDGDLSRGNSDKKKNNNLPVPKSNTDTNLTDLDRSSSSRKSFPRNSNVKNSPDQTEVKKQPDSVHIEHEESLSDIQQSVRDGVMGTVNRHLPPETVNNHFPQETTNGEFPQQTLARQHSWSSNTTTMIPSTSAKRLLLKQKSVTSSNSSKIIQAPVSNSRNGEKDVSALTPSHSSKRLVMSGGSLTPGTSSRNVKTNAVLIPSLSSKQLNRSGTPYASSKQLQRTGTPYTSSKLLQAEGTLTPSASSKQLQTALLTPSVSKKHLMELQGVSPIMLGHMIRNNPRSFPNITVAMDPDAQIENRYSYIDSRSDDFESCSMAGGRFVIGGDSGSEGIPCDGSSGHGEGDSDLSNLHKSASFVSSVSEGCGQGVSRNNVKVYTRDRSINNNITVGARNYEAGSSYNNNDDTDARNSNVISQLNNDTEEIDNKSDYWWDGDSTDNINSPVISQLDDNECREYTNDSSTFGMDSAINDKLHTTSDHAKYNQNDNQNIENQNHINNSNKTQLLNNTVSQDTEKSYMTTDTNSVSGQQQPDVMYSLHGQENRNIKINSTSNKFQNNFKVSDGSYKSYGHSVESCESGYEPQGDNESAYFSHNASEPGYYSHNPREPQYASHNPPELGYYSHNAHELKYASHNTIDPVYNSHVPPETVYNTHNHPEPAYFSHNTPQLSYTPTNSRKAEQVPHNSVEVPYAPQNFAEPGYFLYDPPEPAYYTHQHLVSNRMMKSLHTYPQKKIEISGSSTRQNHQHDVSTDSSLLQCENQMLNSSISSSVPYEQDQQSFDPRIQHSPQTDGRTGFSTQQNLDIPKATHNPMSNKSSDPILELKHKVQLKNSKVQKQEHVPEKDCLLSSEKCVHIEDTDTVMKQKGALPLTVVLSHSPNGKNKGYYYVTC